MATGITIAALAVLAAVSAAFVLRYVRLRGDRIVTCPETHLPVGTKIGAAVAAASGLVAQPRFVISACSHWPERAGCDQACVPQIAASPDETLVRTIVARWYAARTCVYCARPIGDLGGAVVPALRDAGGELREWTSVPPAELPRLLERAAAVCATCELAEDFRRRFPQRVIDRPAVRIVDSHAPVSQAVY